MLGEKELVGKGYIAVVFSTSVGWNFWLQEIFWRISGFHN